MLFLKGYRDQLFDYFPSWQHLNIAIGKGNEDLPEGTLCIGNCTGKWQDRRPFVAGCPPVTSEILRTLTGKPSIDTRDGRSAGVDKKDQA